MIFIAWEYDTLATVFTNVPKDYQWILGFLHPYVMKFSAKLATKVALKAAGKESKRSSSIKRLVQHFITAKHAVFLSIIVGNVATPLTKYCIFANDFGRIIYAGLKIVRNKNKGQNVEGCK